MKILIISSAAIPAPIQEGYGGLEAITGWLTLEFAKAGNDVTLITTNGSAWEGSHSIMRDTEKIGSMTVIGTIDPNWDGASEQNHYLAYRDLLEKEYSDGNSVVLDSTWYCFSYLSKPRFPNMNLMHVHHGMLGMRSSPPILHPRFIGLSGGHAHYLSSMLNIPTRVVHNGIPLVQFEEGYDPLKHKGDYLLSLNRITDEKGIHDSIDVAIATNNKIVLVGDDTHVNDQSYVNQIIERCRHSNGLAQYLGLVDNPTKNQLIMNCKALIACPKNSWIEAAGLYVLEGLAYHKPFLGLTGTLFKHGYNDVIQNGVNGYLAENPDQLKQYVQRLDDINPFACRETVEQDYTKEIMARNYLEMCQKIIDKDPTSFW